jgi:hypothetical protein
MIVPSQAAHNIQSTLHAHTRDNWPGKMLHTCLLKLTRNPSGFPLTQSKSGTVRVR